MYIENIYHYRNKSGAGFLIAYLDWVEPPQQIVEKGDSIYYLMPSPRHYVIKRYLKGKVKLIVKDYIEEKNIKTEKVLEILKSYNLDVYGSYNKLIASQLQKIFYETDLSEEDQEELGDLLKIKLIPENLISLGDKLNLKIINEQPIPSKCLAIALKICQNDFYREIFNYTESNQIYEYNNIEWQMEKIRNEPSMYNPPH